MKIWKKLSQRFDNSPENLVKHPQFEGVYIEKHQLPGSNNDNPMFNSPYKTLKQEEAKYKSKFDWLFEPNKGVRWDFNPMLTRNLAQDDTWVQMLIVNITKEVANTPWQIVENDDPEVQKAAQEFNPFERVSKGVDAKAADSQVADDARMLLRSPNPDEDFTDFVTQLEADFLEVGSLAIPKMFAERDYNGDELVSSDPTLLHIKSSDPATFTKDYQGKTGMLQGFYQYDQKRNTSSSARSGRSKPIRFTTDELAWSDLNPRSNRRYGMPPTLIVKDWLMLMDLTTEQEKRYWSRGAFPAGFIKSDGDIDEIQALKGEVEEGRGKPEKQIMHIQDPDAEWVQMGLNWKELEMNEREEWYAKIIASAFQVPTSVVGLKPDDVNRSTFQGERENFESNTLGPYMQKLERVINSQIIWKHFSTDIRFEFKPGMSETQRQSISDRVTNEFVNDLITRNEARTQLGYEELDDQNDGFREDVTEESESDGLEDLVSSKKERECSCKNEPLRETEDWNMFEVQPSDVEEFHDELKQDIEELWGEIVSDERIQEIIERFAEEDVEKNSSELRRLLRNMIETAALSQGIKETVVAFTGEKAAESLARIQDETDIDVDDDPVLERIQNRDLQFADNYAQRFEEEIRDTVSSGWTEEKTLDEIQGDLQDKAEEFSDFQAERIARDQLQRATGEARNEFARQTDKVEVWLTAGDNRVRPAHQEMDGKWKRPNEDWVVDYERAGEVKESFPGDSKQGIQCRCDTILRDIGDVDQSDHRGTR